MNIIITDLKIGDAVNLNLLKEPIEYDQVKVDGIMKYIPKRELVDCTIKQINITAGKINFSRNDNPERVFLNYSITESDRLVEIQKTETAKDAETKKEAAEIGSQKAKGKKAKGKK